eukprot:Gregarina_sp_Poly_1__3665@NODE_207_length_11414_cov_43_030493_g184_i0_p5_GENE_NODE_207_length_11414_cov_43_030493_g184_i0NODE_207_length_11414_cov_43_030493_g184_i0_p5_ORF_typecomplete_len359_score49_12_NODE_207_length_11414_cov_43_030493_g184_i027013777
MTEDKCNIQFDPSLKNVGRHVASRMPGGSTLDKVQWMQEQFSQQHAALRFLGGAKFPHKLSDAQGQDPAELGNQHKKLDLENSIGLILHDRGPKPVFAPLPGSHKNADAVAEKLALEGIERVPTLTEDELKAIKEEDDKEIEKINHYLGQANDQATLLKKVEATGSQAGHAAFQATVPQRSRNHPYIQCRYGQLAANPLAAFLPTATHVPEDLQTLQNRLLFPSHLHAEAFLASSTSPVSSDSKSSPAQDISSLSNQPSSRHTSQITAPQDEAKYHGERDDGPSPMDSSSSLEPIKPPFSRRVLLKRHLLQQGLQEQQRRDKPAWPSHVSPASSEYPSSSSSSSSSWESLTDGGPSDL